MMPRIFKVWAVIVLFLVLPAPVAFANYLGDITVFYETPSSLSYNSSVEVACDWKWLDDGDDVIMFVTAFPMTNGEISPGSHTEDFEAGNPGQGRCWPWFTIQSGETVVDEILLQMRTVFPQEILLEVRIPVWLHFGPHSFEQVTVDPDGTQRMKFGQLINLDFVWRTDHVGGHRMVVRPLTNGDYTPNMGANGSGIHTGDSGFGSAWFTVLSGDVDVDGIVLEMYNDDWSVLLYEFRFPANYHFGPTAIQNIVLSPGNRSSLLHGEDVTITFDFVTDHPMDPVVYAIPQTEGSDSPGHILNSPMPLPPMSGSGLNTFTIDASAGFQDVDEILFIMRDYFDEEILIDEFRMPVYYHFADCAVRDVYMEPAPPAILSHDEWVNVEFSFTNGHPEAGWLSTIPNSWGVETPNVESFAHYMMLPGTDPTVTHAFRITEGEHLVDQLHFEMLNEAEDSLWMTYFYNTWLYYGSAVHMTPVIDLPAVPIPVLYPNYPNPFNPGTTIKFDLPADMMAGVKVYDLRGRLVKTLAGRRMMTAGEHREVWDGKNETGRRVAAGVYLYRLEAEDFSQTKLMTLVK